MSPASERPACEDPSTGFLAFDDGGLPASAFEALTGAFAEHLGHARGGMAFAVYRAGRPLARFYGGSRSERATPREPVADPWTPDTMTVLFSGSKGLVATIAAMLAGRGRLDVRAPVSRYWPEFAAGGKEEARVWHLLSHTIGLPYVDPEPPGEWGALDNTANAQALARQSPLWEPGREVAYHAMTYGYLAGELLGRITGESMGGLIRRELAGPAELDVHLGLPAALDGRVAPVFRAPDYGISTFLNDPERRKVVDRMYRSTLGRPDFFDSPRLRRGELAAGGAIGSADAMADLYSRLVDPARAGGGLVDAGSLAEATRAWAEGIDAINDRPLRFGLGYELDDPIGTYGPVRPAFGHSGAGGGLHGAWPEHGLGFSFLSNEMLTENQDARAKDLLAALATAL